MSPDLRHATVFVSALETADPEVIAVVLNRASGFIQKQLGNELELKFTPKLKFVADDRFDEARHIDDILDRPGVKRDLDHGDED